MIVGIDYASVDGNRPPDFNAIKAAARSAGSSVGFAILRGAWGTSPDDTIGRDWKRASDAGIVCGAYLYLRLPKGGYKESAEDQVHVFADVVGALTDRNLVPTIDVEDSGLPAQVELDFVRRAWESMRSIYGVPPMIYTSNRVWVEDLKNLPAGDMVDSPLWLAKPWPWVVHAPAVLSGDPFKGGKYDPTVPQSWGPKNWWIHQYQGDARPVPGFSNTVDLSRFNLMRQGETGARVAWVQRRLGMIADGQFSAAMATRVKAFQVQSHLDADAVIGPKTFAAISWCAGVEHPRAA